MRTTANIFPRIQLPMPGKDEIFFSDNAIISGYNELSDTELMQCKNLFDNHYGKWGEGSEHKGMNGWHLRSRLRNIK